MMRLLALCLSIVLLTVPKSALADAIDELVKALAIPEIVAIMREEGIDYGVDMEDELFPDRGGAAWSAVVEQIYDPLAMERTVAGRLREDLSPDLAGPLLEFFTSEPGRSIVSFEISARRAFLDEDVEEAAEARWEDMKAEGHPRLEMIDRFITANDLLESNVMGAMNSNYAFYQGLATGAVFGGSLTDDQILADVWSQEPEIRAETEAWVNSYLAMAYQPLDDADLEAYIEVSETRAGRVLNRALFAGFDDMYVSISRALGVAAARFMTGQDI
jgi:hypothetical protein